MKHIIQPCERYFDSLPYKTDFELGEESYNVKDIEFDPERIRKKSDVILSIAAIGWVITIIVLFILYLNL